MMADQVILGYQGGHRLLSGSIDLDRESGAALLGASDASVTPETDRLLTGLALPSARRYALCGTWAAPEAGRPGAVWAHALLITFAELAELQRLDVLLSALRKPSYDTASYFSQPVVLAPEQLDDWEDAEPSLVARFIAIGDKHGSPTVTMSDLRQGERALMALWQGAPRDARASFSFRTRERARPEDSAGYMCAARRVVGMWRPTPLDPELVARMAKRRWVRELATNGRDTGTAQSFRRFVQEFGNTEEAIAHQYLTLGELYELLPRANARATAIRLARRHPEPAELHKLKRTLFGPGPQTWWHVPELELCAAIVSCGGRGFDLNAIDFDARARVLVSDNHGLALVAAQEPGESEQIRAALLSALVDQMPDGTFGDLCRLDSDLALDVVMSRPELLADSRTWAALGLAQAERVAETVELTDAAIAAALDADMSHALERVIAQEQAVRRLASGKYWRVAGRLLIGSRADEMNDSRLRVAMAGRGIDAGSHRELLDALEDCRRDSASEDWLRAAMHAVTIGNHPPSRRTLEVVFGPVHRAITEERFPDDLWGALDTVTPPAPDLALRWRRLLVDRARAEHWPPNAVQLALRGGGRYVGQLESEITDDDPIASVAKAAFKAIRKLAG